MLFWVVFHSDQADRSSVWLKTAKVREGADCPLRQVLRSQPLREQPQRQAVSQRAPCSLSLRAEQPVMLLLAPVSVFRCGEGDGDNEHCVHNSRWMHYLQSPILIQRCVRALLTPLRYESWLNSISNVPCPWCTNYVSSLCRSIPNQTGVLGRGWTKLWSPAFQALSLSQRPCLPTEEPSPSSNTGKQAAAEGCRQTAACVRDVCALCPGEGLDGAVPAEPPPACSADARAFS